MCGVRVCRRVRCEGVPPWLMQCPVHPAVSLIGLDDGNVTRVSRFANYLRNILPNSDVTVMEMGAKAIGRLALAESALTAEYVEFEVRRALEWLSQERLEQKRHAAVSGRGSVTVSGRDSFTVSGRGCAVIIMGWAYSQTWTC